MHGARILAAAEAALRVPRIKASDWSIHAWQLRNIAGVARIAHGSYPVYVGQGTSSVHHQQGRPNIIGAQHTTHAGGMSDRAKISMVADRIRGQFKAQRLIVRTIDSGNDDYTVIVTSSGRLRLWAHHCWGTQDDTRRWEHSLLPSADGTGGVCMNIDGRRVFLNGIALRAMVASEETVAVPPNPILVIGAFQTGRNTAAWSAVMSMFDELLHSKMGYKVSPPPGIYTDCDRAILNAMCLRWCGDANYKAWLSRLWKVCMAAFQLYKSKLNAMTALGPA